MKHVRWLVVGVIVLGLLAALSFTAGGYAEQGSGQDGSVTVMQVAQGSPPPPPGGFGGQAGPGGMTQADMEKMRQQMQERMLAQLGLTDTEKTAAKQALSTKQAARTKLQAALATLRTVAQKTDPTDQELTDALAAYRAAMTECRTQVEKADADLVKQLSLKSQVTCLAAGVLENGLGMMGSGRGPGGGPGGMGMPGGGPGGGPNGAPGGGPDGAGAPPPPPPPPA